MTTTITIQDAIDQYSDLIAHVAWRIVQDREETRDICQETFLRFCAARDRDETIHSPKAWLCRIALNLAVDTARRRDKARDYQSRPPHEAEHIGQDGGMVERHLLIEQVRGIALQLPDRQRDVFILRNFDDLSYAEIGTIVDCTPETPRVHEYHAIQKIRSLLKIRTGKSGSAER